MGIAQLQVTRRRRGGVIPALLSGPIMSIGRPSPDAPLRRRRVPSRRCSSPISSALRPSQVGSVLLEAGNQVGPDRGESGLLQWTERRGRLIGRPELGGKGGETAAQSPDRVRQSDQGDFPGRVPDDRSHGGECWTVMLVAGSTGGSRMDDGRCPLWYPTWYMCKTWSSCTHSCWVILGRYFWHVLDLIFSLL